MDLTIILTVGKYAMIVAIYAFVLVVFRGIISQLAAESRRDRELSAMQRSGGDSRRRSRVRAAARPAPPQAPPARKPVAAPAPPLPPEERPEPEEKPAAAPPRKPPEGRAARIDLLSEPEEVVAARPEGPPEPSSLAEPPAVMEAGAPHLRVIESDDTSLAVGDRIGLSAAVTIGRSGENSLQVADRFISSRHALVCLREGRRILVDRGSTNGTFVNGDRVEDEVELSDGDRIALGNTVVEYHAR
ncbi:MAG: FHA domain-containing protein [Armatimonadota bacterium]